MIADLAIRATTFQMYFKGLYCEGWQSYNGAIRKDLMTLETLRRKFVLS